MFHFNYMLSTTVFNGFFQMKRELSRIVGSDNVMTDVTEQWELKKQSVLEALRKSNCRSVMNILATLYDTEVLDEKGSFKQFDEYRITDQCFVGIHRVYVDAKFIILLFSIL